MKFYISFIEAITLFLISCDEESEKSPNNKVFTQLNPSETMVDFENTVVESIEINIYK